FPTIQCGTSKILIDQLREITGIQDPQVLYRALNVRLPKDELQTAIELSLQESHKAQEEEREFNRALEASAEENAARMKRKRCEAQSDMCSPADWIRQDDWPVGIRNVGNTCWFSAVIQVRIMSSGHPSIGPKWTERRH
uniref:ubiquitinyl hydrolase 1 n=1 Tax=Cyclopterus lumpus TaxID=8103 RepID=A0A8C2WHM9_CYCLU